MDGIANRLFRGSVFRVAYYVSAVAVSFFMMPFIVYSLGDRWYGFWSMVGVFIGYYGYFDLGLSTAVQRFISGAIGTDDYDECNRIMSTAVMLFGLIGLIVIAITAVIALMIPFAKISEDEVALFRVIVILLGTNMAVEFPIRAFRGILVSKLRYDTMSHLQFVTLALRTAGIILVLTAGYKLLAMAWVTVLAGIPEKILTLLFSRRNLPSLRLSREYLTRGTARKLFSFSIFVFLAQIADILRFHLDFLVITVFLGLSAVTHYKVGSLLSTHFLTLIVTCTRLLLPVFSRLHGINDQLSTRNTFLFTNKIVVCISTFVGFGLIFWGRPFIERWMGPGYLDAYPVLCILVVGIIFALWQSPSFDLLLGTSRQKFVAAINISEGIGNLVISLIFVRYYGLIGVALGTLIPMAVIKLIVQPIYVARLLSMSYEHYIYSIGKPVLLAFATLVVPALASLKFAAPDYLVLFSLASASLVFYALISWVIQFTSSEARMIRQVIFYKGK